MSSLVFSQTDKSIPLKQPDAILHPNVENFITDFINEDGDTADLIEFLSKGYIGKLHKIDILGSIMSKHGFDFQKIMQEFLQKKVIQLFESDKFDAVVSDRDNIPQWVEQMISTPFWAESIINLEKKYSRSEFVKYCFSQICQKHPEYVKEMPSYVVSFDDFRNLFHHYSLNLTAENEKDFINIVTADDRTILFTAMCLDRNTQVVLIRKIESTLRTSPSLELFQKTCMKLDNWSNEMINAYFGKIELRPDHVEMFESYANISTYSKDLSMRKITASLLDRNVRKETTEKIVHYLMEQEGQNNDEETQLIIKGVNIIRKWSFVSKDDLWYALHCTKHYIIATNVIEHITTLINAKQLPKRVPIEMSPEVLILEEIFYWHPSLHERVFKRIKFMFNIDKGEDDVFRTALYDSLIFFFNNEMPLEVLDLMKDPKVTMDTIKERAFFLKLIPHLRAPYTEDFIKKLARVFNSKKVKTVFFPLSSGTVSQINISALTQLKKFIETANNEGAFKGMPQEALIFDELRSDASKVINSRMNKMY